MPSCRRFASLLPNATRPQRNLTKKTAASYARVGNRVGCGLHDGGAS